MNKIKSFLTAECLAIPGAQCRFSDFAREFLASLPASERTKWGPRAIGAALDAAGVVRGAGSGNHASLANLNLRSRVRPLVRDEQGRLRRV